MKVVLVGIEFLEKARRDFIDAFYKLHHQISEVKATPDVTVHIAKEKPDLLLIDTKTVPAAGRRILPDIGEQFPDCTIVLTANMKPNSVIQNILVHGGLLPIKNRGLSNNNFNPDRPPLDVGHGVSDDSLDFMRLIDQMEREEFTANQEASPNPVIQTNGNGAKAFPQQPRVVLPELHDPNTGRLNAEKIAGYLGIPLSKLASGLKVNYGTVHKTPSAESLQSALRPVKRSLEILTEVVGGRETVLAWLNSPHPDLDKKTPLQLIQEGRAEELEAILENAVAAIPY